MTKYPLAPTVEEFEAAIVESVDSGIRDDCRRIEKWIAENSASWPPEIQRKAESIPLITAHIRRMFVEGKPDKLIHSRHTALWTAVKAVNRELDKPYVETGRRIKSAARAAHEAVYGTDDEKRARWRAIVDDLEAEIASGTKKTAAYAIVAEKHGISAKTVQRAPGYLNKS